MATFMDSYDFRVSDRRNLDCYLKWYSFSESVGHRKTEMYHIQLFALFHLKLL